MSVELSYTEAHQAVALQRGVSAKELKDWAETDEEVKSRQIQLLKIIFDHVKSLQLSSSSSSLTATSADGPSSTQIISNDPLLRNTPMKVLLVSHGGFIRRFISNMCPAGNTTYPAGSLRKIHNGALSVVHVTYTKDGLVEECTLDEVYANYSTHLQPVLDKEIIFT